MHAPDASAKEGASAAGWLRPTLWTSTFFDSRLSGRSWICELLHGGFARGTRARDDRFIVTATGSIGVRYCGLRPVARMASPYSSYRLRTNSANSAPHMPTG